MIRSCGEKSAICGEKCKFRLDLCKSRLDLCKFSLDLCKSSLNLYFFFGIDRFFLAAPAFFRHRAGRIRGQSSLALFGITVNCRSITVNYG